MRGNILATENQQTKINDVEIYLGALSMKYTVAAEKDLPFIMEVYNQNIEALHGNNRSNEAWRKLLSDTNSAYYKVLT